MGRRSATSDTAILAIGSIVSGLAAYAFIAIGTRTVGPGEFASVSVLWTFWAMSAAVLTFPVQHWVIRTVEAAKGEGAVRSALPRVFQWALAISILLGAVSALSRDTLFGSGGFTFPLLTALIPLGTVLMGVNRGVLAARGQFGSTALAIAGENVIRVIAALFAASAAGFGWSLAAGFTVAVLWPSSFTLKRDGARRTDASPLAFLGGAAGGSLIGQLTLTSGPVVLAAIGGAAAHITGLFSALALFRAPYMVIIGITPRLTAWLTRTARDSPRQALRQVVARIVVWGAALASLAGVIAFLIGPALLTVVFGSGVTLPRSTTAVLATGSMLAIVAMLLTLILLAAGRTGAITGYWALAASIGALVVALGPGQPTTRVSWGFVVAEVAAITGLALAALAAGEAAAPERLDSIQRPPG